MGKYLRRCFYLIWTGFGMYWQIPTATWQYARDIKRQVNQPCFSSVHQWLPSHQMPDNFLTSFWYFLFSS